MKFELMKLPYSFDSLEPFMDTVTLEIHYGKHHQTYVNNLNKALESFPGSTGNLEDLLNGSVAIPEEISVAVKNNAGGVYNHNFFWSGMRKGVSVPESKLIEHINKSFGNIESFKERFTKTALSRFGSGWTWLVLNQDKELEVYSTANQDSPISDKKIPLLTIDVWEHAYYLKYQNRRAEYVENWWNLVDWNKASELYDVVFDRIPA